MGFISSPFAKLLMLLMLVPVGSLLRQLITGWFGLLGLEEERTAGRMLGSVIGGFASIGRIIKGMGKGGAGAVVGGVAGFAVGGPWGAAAGALAGGASGAPDVLGGFTEAGGVAGASVQNFGIGGALGGIGSSAGSVLSSGGTVATRLMPAGAQGGDIGPQSGDVGTVVSYSGNQMVIDRPGASPVTVPVSSYTGDDGSPAIGQTVRIETAASELGSTYVSEVVPIGFGTYKDLGNDAFGVVEMGNGSDIYVHRDNCPGGRLPVDGQQVTFDYQFGGWLPEAVNVQYRDSGGDARH